MSNIKTLLCGLVGISTYQTLIPSTKDITGHQNSKRLNEDFLAMFDSTNLLTQVVDFTTRKGSTLDLFLTDRPGLIRNC